MLDVTLMTIESARSVSHKCDYCSGHGLAKVWDPHFDGRPYVEYHRPNGKTYQRAMTSLAYCVCAAGRKTMIIHQQHSKDMFARITDLQMVIDGGSVWTEKDPTAPTYDPGEEVAPGDFAAMLAHASKTMTHVKTVNREHRQKERERWLIQLLVHVLREGPTAFTQIYDMAQHTGRGDVKAIQRAAEILGVQKEQRISGEFWFLPKG